MSKRVKNLIKVQPQTWYVDCALCGDDVDGEGVSIEAARADTMAKVVMAKWSMLSQVATIKRNRRDMFVCAHCALDIVKAHNDVAATEHDVPREYGNEIKDTLVAIKEAIDAPYDQTALDAVKALYEAHQTAKRLIGQVVLAVAEFSILVGAMGQRATPTNEDARKKLDAARDKIITAAKRMANKATSAE